MRRATRIGILPRRLTVPVAMALSAAIATLAALWCVAAISVLPPSIHARQLHIGGAVTHVMLDTPQSLSTSTNGIGTELPVLVKGATLYGNLLRTPPVLKLVARRMGVPIGEISATTRLTDDVQRIMREPDSEQRATQILVSKAPYRLDIQPDPNLPIIHIFTQAPSAAAAEQLADSAAGGLQDFLHARAHKLGVDPRARISVDQLGPARGGVINRKTPIEMVVLTWLVAFGLSLVALLGGARVRHGWIAHRAGSRSMSTATLGTRRNGARAHVGPGGDWPHTTRVMPWMIAGFMVLLWLVPFNVIQLTVSLPFDMKLDRMVLPVIFGVWLLSLATGGPAAPRPRLTLVHVGIGLFVAVTCLGVVLDAHYLNQTLEFELSLKKISLLLSYALFFLIVASSVRRTEVPAFFKYTLCLAVLCAIGTIWEYRFHYNVFYDMSRRLLPGFFTVAQIDPNQVDDIGRRMTMGPAEHPLETVSMLSMAFPVALVGIIHSKRQRNRVLYSIAAMVLLAAMISTYRKSALLAPLGIALTVAYFRRRELLRLAPLGVVSLAVIHALSPGALGSIILQLHPSHFGVSTVSDRTSDYDAVRPDLWTHLAFGRGYGSYDHVSYRVLDSEVLGRLIDTGILGLLSLILMLMFIVLAAREPIKSRHPVWAPPALAVAAAAIGFLVLTFLYDVSAYPHTPYILMTLAGLLAVIIAEPAGTLWTSHRRLSAGGLRGLSPQRRPIPDDHARSRRPVHR